MRPQSIFFRQSWHHQVKAAVYYNWNRTNFFPLLLVLLCVADDEWNSNENEWAAIRIENVVRARIFWAWIRARLSGFVEFGWERDCLTKAVRARICWIWLNTRLLDQQAVLKFWAIKVMIINTRLFLLLVSVADGEWNFNWKRMRSHSHREGCQCEDLLKAQLLDQGRQDQDLLNLVKRAIAWPPGCSEILKRALWSIKVLIIGARRFWRLKNISKIMLPLAHPGQN